METWVWVWAANGRWELRRLPHTLADRTTCGVLLTKQYRARRAFGLPRSDGPAQSTRVFGDGAGAVRHCRAYLHRFLKPAQLRLAQADRACRGPPHSRRSLLIPQHHPTLTLEPASHP